MSLSLRSLPRNQSLQEQVYHALRTAILSGELAAGARLVETQLANQLQVSRTPIREALRLLQHDNLAIAAAKGAIHVATLSVQDAAQLYDCRIALEQQSVIAACQQITEPQLQSLAGMLEQAEKLATSKPSQLTQFQMLDLDYQFHRLIARSSGNLWLVSLLDQVFDQMQLLRIQTMRHNPQVLEIRVEHGQIYQAIAQRDAEAAQQAIVAHLTASKDRVMREVSDLQQPTESVQ